MRVLAKVVSLLRLGVRMQCLLHHSLEKRKNAVLRRAPPRQMWPGRSEVSYHRLHDASPLWGSNPRPYAYEAHALPTELRRQLHIG